MNKNKGSKFKKMANTFCKKPITVNFDNPTQVGILVDISNAIIMANDSDPIKDTDPCIKATLLTQSTLSRLIMRFTQGSMPTVQKQSTMTQS